MDHKAHESPSNMLRLMFFCRPVIVIKLVFVPSSSSLAACRFMDSLDASAKQAPRLASIASRNLDLCGAMCAVRSLLSRLPVIGGPSEADESGDETASGSRPSPSLIPLPITSDVPGPAKNPCPVLSYREFLERRGGQPDGRRDTGLAACAVCMSCLEGSDQVRELCYCAHAFHRGCLDTWIDRGHDTCPICRAKLWSDRPEEPRDAADPWRAERMVYFFGGGFGVLMVLMYRPQI